MNPREIDAKIAEMVMGWTVTKKCKTISSSDGLTYFCKCCGRKNRWWDDFGPYPESFSPSTSISDAFLVVEKMRERGFTAYISAAPDGAWEVTLLEYDKCASDATANNDSLPTAISLAALRAVDSDNVVEPLIPLDTNSVHSPRL